MERRDINSQPARQTDRQPARSSERLPALAKRLDAYEEVKALGWSPLDCFRPSAEVRHTRPSGATARPLLLLKCLKKTLRRRILTSQGEPVDHKNKQKQPPGPASLGGRRRAAGWRRRPLAPCQANCRAKRQSQSQACRASDVCVSSAAPAPLPLAAAAL